MNILFLSHTFIGSPYVVGSHHLSRELAKQGHKVVHVPHPWSRVHQWVRGDRDSFVRDQVWQNCWQFEVADLLPSKWHLMSVGYDSLCQRLAKNIAMQSKHIGIDEFDVCFVDDPIFTGVVPHLAIGKTVYRPTDIYTEMPKGSAYKSIEQQLIKQSDAVVATSQAILDYHQLDEFENTTHLPNGFDYHHFANTELTSAGSASPTQAATTSLRVAYVGSLDARFDAKLINQAVLACPNVQFDIYSPDAPDNLELDLPNLDYLGAIDYQKLPKTLVQYDLLLMPFTFALSNKGRSPMKFFEYAASNVPMLVPSYFNTYQLDMVYTFDNQTQFIETITQLAPGQRAKRDPNALVPHAWHSKAKQLLEMVA